MTPITSPDRWIFFRTEDEAARWRKVIAEAGLQATVAVWDAPSKDDRGYWQPPRVFWRDYKCPKCNQVFKLYWIDGFWYRNNVHIDFSEGGNPSVYREMPANCLYLEPSYLEHTKDEEIVGEDHESPEHCDMSHIVGCCYEEAHGIATRQERGKREAYREIPALPESEAAKAHGFERLPRVFRPRLPAWLR